MEALLCGSRRSGVRVSGAKLRRGEAEEDGVTNNVDILNEIFKHLDAASLGKVACVSSKWRQATEEEALWEAICKRQWHRAAPAASAPRQLKSVVVALGGFKRLYVNFIHPILTTASRKKWGKDDFYLSLSLFSIDCYERIKPKTSSASSGSFADSLCKPSFKTSSSSGSFPGSLCKPSFKTSSSSSSASFAGSFCKPSFNSDVRRLLLDGWKGKCADQVENSNNNC
ncbi:hypothetical protein SUGI_0660370 [Cryptomeria japonica]|uniref:F-box protein GID2 n=1 Tax=Cryptomeria japonica TaxID=3369 RepID=UPI002414C54B|nr:F-box protein GID2 [Cryptomeria japonica]GLJ32795.1 hypothetical protein SUGI_0660370 [Cryptomeria japonica]